MLYSKKTLLTGAVLSGLYLFSFSANALTSDIWQPYNEPLPPGSSQKPGNQIATLFKGNFEQLNSILSKRAETKIEVPLPSGEIVSFQLSPNKVLPQSLADKYQNISTYSGVATTNRNLTGKFDVTENGFHGMFDYNGRTVFIEPVSRNGKEIYRSYYRSDWIASDRNAQKIRQSAPKVAPEIIYPANKRQAKASAISQMREFRLAVSATAEYTNFHGGTVGQGLSAIVTMVNRLNQVFERDLTINLKLVDSNDQLIFTNASTDPFDNTDDDGSINTAFINDTIGVTNYDVGHVVGTGGGGLAILGGVCSSVYKGDGVTGSSRPENDAFIIDYVAHELGHQFGADHTFNGQQSACSGNRASNAAYEPGSGSTIMSYAGICGDQNLQNLVDDFFHSHSVTQVSNFKQSSLGSSCGQDIGAANEVPEVNAGNDFIIPANTPFELTGSATDADNDTLDYSWQQYDLGAQSSNASEQVDDGSRPLFRAFEPSSSLTRVLPKMSDVLASTTTIGETYPTTNRSLTFRLVVRDGKGGVGMDTKVVTVVDTGEAFAVTSPTSNVTWNTVQQQVTWNVAGTADSTVNCQNVNISLSTDGGQSFAHQIAENVAN